MEFKDRLAYLRKEQHLTQAQLGDILEYGATAISSYEKGKTTPSIDKLKKLAIFFDVSIDYLTGLSNIKNYNNLVNDKEFNNIYNMYCKLDNEVKNTLNLFLKFILENENTTQ